MTDFIPSDKRKQQILLIRMALEDFYKTKDKEWYTGLGKELVCLNNGKFQFESKDKEHLETLLNEYTRKLCHAPEPKDVKRVEEHVNLYYLKIKKHLPMPQGKSNENTSKISVDRQPKTESKPKDPSFTDNAIDDALSEAFDSGLIKDLRTRVTDRKKENGHKFIFNKFDYDPTKKDEESLKYFKEELDLYVKSEIPTEFLTLIEYHTKDFIERKDLTNAFEKFKQNNKHGYFILEGEPGVGKTAFLANYVKQNKCPCYFIQQVQGINNFEDFIDSICKQIFDKYYDELSYIKNDLSSDNYGIHDFNRMLQGLTKHLGNSRDLLELVIVIDGLDEVIQNNTTENILKLPAYLPERVYFLISQRPRKLFLSLQVPCEVKNVMDLMKGEGWKIGFEEYFAKYIDKSNQQNNNQNYLRIWIDNQIREESNRFNDESAVKGFLIDRSDRNFRFLKNVLNDLERGLFGRIEDIPQGLNGYYQSHLSLMGITPNASPDRKSVV